MKEFEYCITCLKIIPISEIKNYKTGDNVVCSYFCYENQTHKVNPTIEERANQIQVERIIEEISKSN